jgi:hypothetical protein
MPACHQRFELTFAWTGGCYLFIELALGVVRIVRHKVEPLAEFAHYERRCRAGSQLPTGRWLSASFATRTPGQRGDGPAPCSIAPTPSHWRYVSAQLMIATFALFLQYFNTHKNWAQLLVKSKCVIVDIQIIGRKPHASTGLDGWIGFKNKAIRERSDLPHHSSLPNI